VLLWPWKKGLQKRQETQESDVLNHLMSQRQVDTSYASTGRRRHARNQISALQERSVNVIEYGTRRSDLREHQHTLRNIPEQAQPVQLVAVPVRLTVRRVNGRRVRRVNRSD
jgi:hypothetical protein